MTSMLRYVRCLPKLNGFGWKITHNQQTVITGGKFILQQNDNNFIKSYATATAARSRVTIYGNNIRFQNFEDQMKRTGKINQADINVLVDEIQKLEAVSTLDALLLIRSCGKALIEANSEESIQLVQEIWSTLEALNTSLDVSHYNALLNVYFEKDHDFCPVEFLNMMKEKSIEPNRVTYQRLIRAHCKKGDIAGATKILETMKDKGMPLSEDVFNSLILGHSQANDIENAEKTLDVMKAAGLPPSTDTYIELMCAYGKHGKLDSILTTLKTLPQQEILLSNIHYLDILYSLAVNGHVDKAYDFLNELPAEIISNIEVSRYLAKLIFANHIDLSLKVFLKTTADLTRRKIRMNFFIRALVKSNTPIEKIVEICRYFEEELQQNRAFAIALDVLFTTNPNYEKAIPLLKGWAKLGAEIRNHFFWPLLIHEAKTGNMEGIRYILSSMINDFKIMPSVETLRNYAIPYMYGTWENILEFFEPLKIPKEIIYNAIVDRFLIERRMKNCVLFMTVYPSVYSKDIKLKYAAETLIAREDFHSFVVILRNLTENSEPADVNNTPVSMVDAAIKEVMNITPEFKANMIVKLLDELVQSGLSISPEMATEVRSYLSNLLTDEVEETLKKLTSETTIVPMNEYNPVSPDSTDINHLTNIKKAVELRKKFAVYLQANDANNVYSVIQSFMTMGYVSVPVFAQAIALFSENENLEAAESCVNYLKEKSPNAKLDFKKIIRYSELLIKNDRFSDAIAFIAEQRDGETSEKLSRSLMNNVRALLETTAHKNNVEHLHQLFNLLKSKNYLNIDNFTLGPLIMIHILRNDLESALVAFEKCCKEYRCTPYKNLLAKAFIEAEDPVSLQRMTDFCTEIHGESNALVDLALAFLEHGHPRQAQKIFETPGLQVFNEKIAAAIEHFTKFNKFDALEKFVKITKFAGRMDRAYMYDNLLDYHFQTNNWKAGLALWTDMQEDDVQPTNHFLHILNILLEKNNQKVPFAYNTSQNPKIVSLPQLQDDNFNQHLHQKNYAYVTRLLESENWTRKKFIDKYNVFINTLLEHGELDKALSVTDTLINKYSSVGRRPFNELVHQLIEAKRFDEARKLGKLLDPNMRVKVNYAKFISNIEIHQNGLKRLINNLEVNVSDSHEVRSFEKNIHFGAVVHALLADPKHVDDFEKWALNLWEHGITRGMQALWNYYFITGHAKETELYDNYIRLHSSPLVRPIVEISKKRKDPLLLKKLLERLHSHSQLNINIKARIFSGLIEINLMLNRPEEALEALNEVSRHFRMDVIPKRLLLELKRQCEKNGIQFPYIFLTEKRNQEYEDNNDERQDDTQVEKARV